uniref:Integrase catalytic domain-containing protein n=1 Tax=Photinus pyralis TaxID=7054 RepID=A0A1Y1KRZ4_PHOPY
MELAPFNYDIIYRPGRENHVADALSRISASMNSQSRNLKLKELHDHLCHPGITRMHHWLKNKNLPYTIEEIRVMTNNCRTCAEIKPKYYRHSDPLPELIKATSPFERISIDFKGPVPTNTKNRFILTVIDEYSCFPFAFPCSDVSAKTVITHLNSLFMLFGMPSYVHSDRGASFMSSEVKQYLHSRGIATSRTTAYNPQGNGQVEKLNSTLWKAIQLALKTHNLPIEQWEKVLSFALHSIRSLLCTTINCTPHERMFRHNRRSPNGTSMPTWLTEAEQVLLRRCDRSSKYQPLVEEVDLLESNADYSFVRLRDGRETTVSNRHLAPIGGQGEIIASRPEPEVVVQQPHPPTINQDINLELQDSNVQLQPVVDLESETLRRSARTRRPPLYLRDYSSS